MTSNLIAYVCHIKLDGKSTNWLWKIRYDYINAKNYYRSCQCVDASTSWGIGILINDKWAAWQFLPDTFSASRSIGWAEMVAVELAILLLCSIHPRKSHFLIHSDNQGVIGAVDSSFSRGATQNASLSRLSSTLLNHDSFISTTYIRSNSNPADPVSRGILPPIASRLQTKLKLDPDLLPYLVRH